MLADLFCRAVYVEEIAVTQTPMGPYNRVISAQDIGEAPSSANHRSTRIQHKQRYACRRGSAPRSSPQRRHRRMLSYRRFDFAKLNSETTNLHLMIDPSEKFYVSIG